MHVDLKTASAAAIAVALYWGCASPAWAQPGARAADRAANAAAEVVSHRAEVQEEEDRGVVEEQGPAHREGFSPSDPTFQLLAAKDDKEVSLGITLANSRVHADPSNPYKQRAQSLRFSFVGFAPVDKDGGDRFVNLAKPMSGARIKIGLTYYFSNYTLRQEDIDVAVRVMNLASRNCVRERVDGWASSKPEASRQVAADYQYVIAMLRAGRDDGIVRTNGLEAQAAMAAVESPAFNDLTTIPEVRAFKDDPVFKRLAESKSKELPAFAQLQGIAAECEIGRESGFKSNELFIQRYGDGSPIDSSIRAVTANAPTFFLGGDATFGRKSYSFLDRAAFAIQDKNKGEYQLSAFGGVIGGNGLWSLRAGASRSRTYEAQDEVNLCQATTVAGQTQCLKGPDGAPKLTGATAITLEGRRLFKIPGSASHIGIAPEIAFNPDDSEYTVEVPIYFAPDKDGKLTGGVQFSYGSKKNKLAFGLFVGVPFTVFQ